MKDDLTNISSVIFKLRKFHDNLSLLSNKELRKYGITYPQLIMLYFLWQRKGEETAVKDIEKFMQLTHPTVLGIVRLILKNAQRIFRQQCLPSSNVTFRNRKSKR